MSVVEKAESGLACVVVGEGALALQGVQMLQEAGFAIRSLASPDLSLEALAHRLDVPHDRKRRTLEARLDAEAIPYLFSLNNPWILSASLLSRVQTLAVNYHDSPLPAYAGLNATTWAMLAGETQHGISLHEVLPGIDTGDILVSRDVPILAQDTVETLNVRCFEAAIDAFGELIGRIKDGALVPVAQREEGHSYFGLDARPARGGIVDWRQSAEEVSRLVRGLDFGRTPNPVATAKVLIDGRYLCPRGVRLREGDAAPGTVLRSEPLTVACQTGAVEFERLHNLDGSLFAQRPRVGDVLSSPSASQGDVIRRHLRTSARHESRWAKAYTRSAFSHPWEDGSSDDSTHESEPLNAQLKALAEARDLTVADAACAALAYYLWRIDIRGTGEVIGYQPPVPSQGRLFTKQRPLVIRPNPEETAASFVARVAKSRRRVADAPGVPKDLLWRHRGTPTPLHHWPHSVSEGDIPEGGEVLNLHLCRDAVLLSSRHFSGEHLAKIGEHLLRCVAFLIEDNDRPLCTGAIASLPEATLTGPSLALPDGTIVDALDASFIAHRDAFALRCGDERMRYGEVDEASRNIALGLLEEGLQAGDRIALRLGEPMEMALGILGVLRAGGAYVPVDPSLPEGRSKVIVEDAGARIVVDGASLERLRQPKANGALPRPNPDDPVYAIFTSGSTGRPKGVDVRHRNLLAQWVARTESYGAPPKRFLCLHSTSFDSAVAGFFWTLCGGGELVLTTTAERQSPGGIARQLERQEISHVDIPPATYGEVLRLAGAAEALKHVEVVIVGGEECRAALVRAHQRHSKATLFNEYGPTEATVYCSTYPIAGQAPEPVPIGMPAANFRFYVLDRFQQPLPEELPGELLVAGPSVTAGYIGRAEATAKAFLPDFADANHRMYRTGDLVSRSLEGLVFRGRVDNQVQINGHRVELQEIEETLCQLPGISDAAVRVAHNKDGSLRLLGYYVHDPKGPPNAALLRQQLGHRLPRHMLPAALASIPRIPRTAAGKIDREALPDIQVAAQSYVPPANAAEQRVAKWMAEILGVPRVGRKDSFFDLGGDSLKAMRLVAKANEERSEEEALTVAGLYYAPTVEAFAKACCGSTTETWRYLVPIQPEGSRPPIFGVHILGVGQSYYRPLTEALGLDQPVFGLMAPVGPNGEGAITDVAELAATYIEELVRHQPQGPYYLTAVSLAATVAFEMAQQLRLRGEEVALLGFFDSWGPVAPAVPRKERMNQHVTLLRDHGMQYVRERALERAEALKLRATDTAIGVWNKLGMPVPTAFRQHAIMRENFESTQSYDFEFYPGTITVFRATERVFYGQRYIDEGLGWRSVASSVRILDVPGDHTGILSRPGVTKLADAILRAMDNRPQRTSRLPPKA